MTLKLNGTNSEAAPAYAGDDADTGLQCGTNELKLVTGGTARVTVNSSGRLSSEGTSAIVHKYTGASNPVLLGQYNSSGDASINNQANANLLFATNNTERMRILSSGGLTFNGDTAQANALDDYEEGTWTPTISSAGTISASNARYTKIGDLVHVYGNITSFSNRTSSNTVIITSLPYAAGSNQAAGSAFARYLDRTAYTTYVYSNSLEFYSISSGNFTSLQHLHLNNSSSNIYFQATYTMQS